MRILAIILLGLATLLGAWYFLIFQPSPSSEQVIGMLRENNEKLNDAEISLVGCQLSVRSQATSPNGSLSLEAMETDLGEFQLQSAQVSVPKPQYTVLTILRKPVSDSFLEQAQRIVDIMPAKKTQKESTLTMLPNSGGKIEMKTFPSDPEGKISTEQLRKTLSQPNAALTFRYATGFKLVDGQLEQRLGSKDDAEKFYDFYNKLIALKGPLIYSAKSVFSKSPADPDTLAAGMVSVTDRMQFLVDSTANVRPFLDTLYQYQQATCP